MTRWIMSVACVFVFLLAPARRSAESSSSMSYTSDDEQTVRFEFYGETDAGYKDANDIHLESHGVITMAGGNFQQWMIPPSQVDKNGNYITTN